MQERRAERGGLSKVLTQPQSSGLDDLASGWLTSLPEVFKATQTCLCWEGEALGSSWFCQTLTVGFISPGSLGDSLVGSAPSPPPSWKVFWGLSQGISQKLVGSRILGFRGFSGYLIKSVSGLQELIVGVGARVPLVQAVPWDATQKRNLGDVLGSVPHFVVQIARRLGCEGLKGEFSATTDF